MDNLAQRSDSSLKQSDVIEICDSNAKTANDLHNVFTARSKGVSGRNTHHASAREAANTMKLHFSGVHIEDKAVYCHWSPVSQTFFGGDALLTALDSGWEIMGPVLRQEYSCTSNRCTYVYHIELHRDWEIVCMRVIENPCVTRMLHQFQAEITRK